MTFGQWVLAVSSVVIGGLLTLSTNWFIVSWQTKKAERANNLRRSKEAAESLLDLVDEAGALFEGLWKHGSAPSQGVSRSVVRRIERQSLLLHDEIARRNIDRLATSFSHVNDLDHLGQGSPAQVAHKLRWEARLTLGALLRDEQVEESETLASHKSELDDLYSDPD